MKVECNGKITKSTVLPLWKVECGHAVSHELSWERAMRLFWHHRLNVLFWYLDSIGFEYEDNQRRAAEERVNLMFNWDL